MGLFRKKETAQQKAMRYAGEQKEAQEKEKKKLDAKAEVRLNKLLVLNEEYEKHLIAAQDKKGSDDLEEKLSVVSRVIAMIKSPSYPDKSDHLRAVLVTLDNNKQLISKRRNSYDNKYLDAVSKFLSFGSTTGKTLLKNVEKERIGLEARDKNSKERLQKMKDEQGEKVKLRAGQQQQNMKKRLKKEDNSAIAAAAEANSVK